MRSLSEQCEERRIERERKQASKLRPVKRKKRCGRPATSEQIIEAMKGRSLDEAAQFLGYSRRGLESIMATLGIRREGNRLTAEDRELICQLIEEGLKRAEVAEKFERTEETISDVYHKTRGKRMPRWRPRSE